MEPDQAERAARLVGWGSGAIGIALLAAPVRVTRLLQIEGSRTMQAIGLADLVLAPGLIAGGSRRPWMAARASLNVAIGGFLIQRRTAAHDKRPIVAAVALACFTIGDLRIAIGLSTG